MSAGQWELHDFPAALAKWILSEHPPASLMAFVTDWAKEICVDGPQDHWTIVDDDRRFMVRVPSTNTMVFGEILYHERLLIFTKIDGT